MKNTILAMFILYSVLNVTGAKVPFNPSNEQKEIDEIVSEIRDTHEYYLSSPDSAAGNSRRDRTERRDKKNLWRAV